jgi:hypothetical protein
MSALVFSKPFLLSKPWPSILNHSGAGTLCNSDSRIITAILYNNDLVDPIDDGRDATFNPMRLVLCDDEARDRQFAAARRRVNSLESAIGLRHSNHHVSSLKCQQSVEMLGRSQ